MTGHADLEDLLFLVSCLFVNQRKTAALCDALQQSAKVVCDERLLVNQHWFARVIVLRDYSLFVPQVGTDEKCLFG